MSRLYLNGLMMKLLLLSLGGIAYLAFSALGPFLNEPGMNQKISDVQQNMLAFYSASVDGSQAWQ